MKKYLPKQELLDMANEKIKHRPGFIDGMQVNDAEMVGNILVMRGECFFTPSGDATVQSGPAIEFYNKFAAEFADEYGLLA